MLSATIDTVTTDKATDIATTDTVTADIATDLFTADSSMEADTGMGVEDVWPGEEVARVVFVVRCEEGGGHRRGVILPDPIINTGHSNSSYC